MNKSNDAIHVLFCIDDPTLRRQLGSQLANLGYEPMYANNILECREMARRLQPNIILVCNTMRIKGSIDIIERMKAEESTKKIPIILLTDKNQTETEEIFTKVNGHFPIDEKFTVIAEGIKKLLNESTKREVV